MYLTAILLFTSLVDAEILPRQQTGSDACAQVSRIYYDNAVVGSPYLSSEAQLAYECLNSIPFYPNIAAGFLAEFSKVLQFHSTIEILKDPPETYKAKAVDLIGGLDSISSKVSASEYSSHYEYETELYNLVGSVNDEHFGIILCTLSLFSFSLGNYSLASISSDGVSVPDLFLVDFEGNIVGGDQASPVTKINDQDAGDYLSSITAYENPQDPDASYNTLSPSLAKAAISGVSGPSVFGSVGAFNKQRSQWPGTNSTSITFANGDSQDLPTQFSMALAQLFDSGESLYGTYCASPSSGNGSGQQRRQTSEEPTVSTDIPSTQPEPTESATASYAPALAAPAGYPEPILRDEYNQVIGFYLDDETAVLAFPTFESDTVRPKPDNTSLIVGNIAGQFVQEAVDSGHTKIIIDLSANLGGSITRGYDIFKLFFPDEFPWIGARFRRHTGSELLSKALGGIDPNLAVANGPFTWRVQVTPDQEQSFPSVDDFLGSEVQYGVPVSAEMATWNISAQSNPLGPIRGYGDIPAGNTTQPFSADDIIIITDGVCASTCAAFTYLMTNIGNVRSIAFGGRPQTGPMQLIGGTRGIQTASYDALQGWIEQGVTAAQNNPGLLTEQEIAEAQAVVPLTPAAQWPGRCLGGAVNIRNAYAEGDDQLPLQFQYQAADYRRFFTLENYRDQSTVWKVAKETVWGGGKAVEGSTGGQGSRGNRNGGEDKGTAADGNGSGTGEGTGNAESGGGNSNGVASLEQRGSVAMLSAMVALGVALVL